ncbi:MAG: maleylpyruvate isomerase family mycothiol-dependent enzyme [Candidatus Dormibacteraceae bacterium]
MDLKLLARDERADLAEFLATLSLEQWEAPTLCAGWRVRDVVAHLLSYDELDGRGLIGRFVKGRFRPERINAIGLAEYNTRRPEELLALLRDHLEPRGLPAAFNGMVALTDGLIHHQDIRRPLGMPRNIPTARLLAALRCALIAPVLRGFWRVRGLRLVATDLDWATGGGLQVHGSAEALLMAVAGRRGVVGELSGPGQQKLARRIGSLGFDQIDSTG